MPYEKIDVVVHPQSVIHSLVEYQDGSVFGSVGTARYAFADTVRFFISRAI